MGKIVVFVSYNHEQDAQWFEERYCGQRPLIQWLEHNISEPGVEFWYDRKGLSFGDLLWETIKPQIEAADIAILLVSRGFMNSEFIRDKELPLIERRVRARTLKVIPIITLPCPWQKLPLLNDVLVMPGDTNPLVDSTESPRAYLHALNDILSAIEAHVVSLRSGEEAAQAVGEPDGVAEGQSTKEEGTPTPRIEPPPKARHGRRPAGGTGSRPAHWAAYARVRAVAARYRGALAAACVACLLVASVAVVPRIWPRDGIGDGPTPRSAEPAAGTSEQSNSLDAPAPEPAAAVAPAAKRAVSRVRPGTRGGQETQGPDGGTYAWVPAGEFMMGSEDGDSDEKPVHKVRISKGFWLGKHEVTNAQYRRYCEATGEAFPTDSDKGEDHPVCYVSWNDAKAYCDHYGLSLPTEAQWEYAARGRDALKYPWGNEWDASRCCFNGNRGPGGRTFPVGSFPAGASWCGALDMTGNVYEWCADWRGSYSAASADDPTGPATADRRMLRGGSWIDDFPGNLRAACRCYYGPSSRGGHYGFRCVRGLGVAGE